MNIVSGGEAPRGLHRPPAVYLGLVAGLYLLFWLLALSSRPYTVLFDSADYLAQAELIEGQRAITDPAELTRRPPGYPALLVALRLVSEHPAWVALVQSVLGVLTWGLLYDLLARLGQPRRWAWLVAGLALAPYQLVYAQLVMADVPFTLLVVAAFWALVRYVQGGGAGWLAGYNGLLAAAVLVKPVLVYFWVPNLVLLAWVVARREQAWRRRWPVALGLLLPAVVLAVSFANEARTGHFHYTSIEGTNLFTHNAYRTMIRAHGEAGADAVMEPLEEEAARIADFGEREEFRARAAWRLIFAHLDTYLTIHAQGMAAVLLDPGRFDLYLFFGSEPPAGGLTHAWVKGGLGGLARALGAQPPGELALLLGLSLWNALVLVAAVCFLFDARVPLAVRVAALLLAAYFVGVTGPVGSARYRMPVYPLMLLAVPFFVSRVQAWRRQRALRGAA